MSPMSSIGAYRTFVKISFAVLPGRHVFQGLMREIRVVIVDPFTGSSTTGIAAYLLGRNFVGIDTDKKYLDLSIKRFEELDKNIKSKLL